VIGQPAGVLGFAGPARVAVAHHRRELAPRALGRLAEHAPPLRVGEVRRSAAAIAATSSPAFASWRSRSCSGAGPERASRKP
jgi:hypothetical protein